MAIPGIHFNDDLVAVIRHIIDRTGSDRVRDRVVCDGGHGERIVHDLPVDDLIAVRSRTALRSVRLGRGLVIDLSEILRTVRISGGRVDRKTVLGLIGRDYSVIILVCRKVYTGVICKGDDFIFCHGGDSVGKAGIADAAVVTRRITADLQSVRLDDKGVADNPILDDYILNIPGCGHGDGVMECSRRLIIRRVFLRVCLSRLRFIEYDFTLNFVREMDRLITVGKLRIICVSEADIRSSYQSGVVRIVLVEHYGQHPVCRKITSGIYLIGPAFIYDIDRQRIALFGSDLDALRHLIGKSCIIVKLIG